MLSTCDDTNGKVAGRESACNAGSMDDEGCRDELSGIGKLRLLVVVAVVIAMGTIFSEDFLIS